MTGLQEDSDGIADFTRWSKFSPQKWTNSTSKTNTGVAEVAMVAYERKNYMISGLPTAPALAYSSASPRQLIALAHAYN